MEQATAAPLKKTPLNARHRASGAQMVPVRRLGHARRILGHHRGAHGRPRRAPASSTSATWARSRSPARTRSPPSSASRPTTRRSSQIGQAQYSGLLTPQGTFVDDLLVYRLAAAHFLLVVNAGNIAKDYAWIAEQHQAGVGDAVAVDASSRYALLAVQGPRGARASSSRSPASTSPAMKYYWFAHGEVASVRATISRTGYTGEDGFEIFVPPQSADRVWQAILEAGQAAGLIPCGLGARDTLRLEAGMRLHGNDIDETTTVARGRSRTGSSAGRRTISSAPTSLREQKADGVARKLVGFEMLDRGIARHGYDVYVGGDDRSAS